MNSFLNKTGPVVLSLFLMLLVSCSKDNKSSTQQIETIPIKGNPLNFIAGTRGNTSAGIPEDIFTTQLKWAIFANIFITEPQTKIDKDEDVKEKNKPVSSKDIEDKESRLVVYEMKPLQGNLWSFNRPDRQGLKFIFEKKYNSFYLNKIISNLDNRELPKDLFKIHHYSTHESKEVFSILISIEEGQQKLLGNFVFIAEKDESIFSNMVSTAYNYLFGPGVSVHWDQNKTLDITICESGLKGLSRLSQEGFSLWENPLYDRLNFRSTVVASYSCPPFSDLNTHTVFHVKGYIEYYGKEMLQQGATLNVPNYYSSKIIDADIFVLESDWDEAFGENIKMSDDTVLDNEKIKEIYKTTMAHEFGHLLGLHHQFIESIPSIMGYDGVDRITNYDKNAIQELYPKK